jgi:hypothetical protein
VFKDTPTDEQKEELAAAGGIALGSALAGLGIGQTHMNFRREEFAYQRAFDKLKTALICAVCLLFVICFLLCYCFEFKRSQDKHLLAVQRSIAQNIFQAVARGKKMRGEDTPSIYQSYLEELKALRLGKTSEKAPPVLISALDILNEIAMCVRKTKANFQLTGCTIDQTAVTVEGIVSTQEEGQAVGAAIDRDSKYLTKKSDVMKPTKDGKCQFTYRFAMKQPKDSKEQ